MSDYATKTPHQLARYVQLPLSVRTKHAYMYICIKDEVTHFISVPSSYQWATVLNIQEEVP